MQDYYNDIPFMRLALEEARMAGEKGEVPVGAVIVKRGTVIATGQNRREETGNALAHAECVAIENACKVLGDWHLTGCTLYVTLEPCPMCAGAIVNSRIDRVVYGAKDQAFGCVGSKINLFAMDFNHTPKVTTSVLEEECTALLTRFFQEKRGESGKIIKNH